MKKMDHDKDGRASLSDFREMASTLLAHGNYLSLKQNVTIIFVKNSMAFANFSPLD